LYFKGRMMSPKESMANVLAAADNMLELKGYSKAYTVNAWPTYTLAETLPEFLLQNLDLLAYRFLRSLPTSPRIEAMVEEPNKFIASI
jgi:hypothetical protein